MSEDVDEKNKEFKNPPLLFPYLDSAIDAQVERIAENLIDEHGMKMAGDIGLVLVKKSKGYQGDSIWL